jgi:hypothetical protein
LDDLPHPVPVEGYMTWKENWVFPALDTRQRVAALFHVSLRPLPGEAVYTARFSVDGWEHHYVGRTPLARDLSGFHPIENERMRLEIIKPTQLFRVSYRSDALDASIDYHGRFPRYDFDGPKAPGRSLLGEIGRSVFPFNHHEQALVHEGEIALKEGPRAGETLRVSGYACRDHSWGWRDDLSFRAHHWLCASFAHCYVQGSAMDETYYIDGTKSGGWIATASGNDPVVALDCTAAYWLAPNEPLGALDRDVRYRLKTVSGHEASVVAHLAAAYARLHLNARAADGTSMYEDVQVFCDFTLEDDGSTGAGVLEVGKYLHGADVVERARRAARRR